MKTARENVSIFKLHTLLKRLLDEYEGFDAARRLSADYCITTNDIALIIDEIQKPERSKSRQTFAIRSDRTMDISETRLLKQ
ncbi:MAG: hypothetical protein J2P52_15845 [Blastocatellia bacterium]|nr:hypothetical protein [Blastocatellia bacterium]